MKNNENNKLVPYSSNLGVGTFSNEFDNLVERLFDSFWQEPSFLFQRNWRASDVTNDKDNYYIEIELPGFRKSEIQTAIVNNILQISAKNYKSSYYRTFSISGWNLDKVKSRLENGVLSFVIPKLPEAKEKTIDIEEVSDIK